MKTPRFPPISFRAAKTLWTAHWGKTTLGILLLGGTALALIARSQDMSVNNVTDMLSDVDNALAQLDANRDGKLDRQELKTRAWMLYAIDADGDGALSAQELRAGVGFFSQQLFPSRPAQPSLTPSPPFEPAPSAQRGPKILKGSAWALDTLVPDTELIPLSGAPPRRLRSFAGPRGTVVALLSVTCPISRRYLPTLQRLEQDYAAKGFGFVLIAAPGEDDDQALRANGLSSPVTRDPSGILLRALQAAHTTDVFVIDSAHTLVYRGAIDDQYGLGYNLPAPKHRYLANALDALINAARPRIAATLAPGCELELPSSPPVNPAVITWHNRISRLVQAHCATCHHPGGSAPFALDSYTSFIKKAGPVRRVLSEATMPPWNAAPTPENTHTPWLNETTLPARIKADLLSWLNSDRAEGDPQDAPLERRWPHDWEIGSPDLILQIPCPITVQAEGTMPYQSIMVETKLREDRWVSAWEVRPTARQVVHHVLVYVYPPQQHAIPGSEERSGYLATWVPGGAPGLYPKGFAKALPAGSRLRFEIHYTPVGREMKDQTQLGLKFALTPPDHVVEAVGIANVHLTIPPGAANHPVAATWKAPRDIHLLALSPHMHVRGKAMRFEAKLPGHKFTTLLEVPRYDFNWQIPVIYAEAPALPAGSTLKVTGWFDNSSANPANPDPAAAVRWGSQTNDEMMIGYVEYYRAR